MRLRRQLSGVVGYEDEDSFDVDQQSLVRRSAR